MAFDSGQDRESGGRETDRPANSMMGAGIAIGAGLGVALGVALDMLPLGIAIGAGIGVAIGAAMDQSRGVRSIEQYERPGRNLWVVAGLGLAVLLVLLGAFVFLKLR